MLIAAAIAVPTSASCGPAPHGSSVAVASAIEMFSSGVVSGSLAAMADAVLMAYSTAAASSATAITTARLRGRRRTITAAAMTPTATAFSP